MDKKILFFDIDGTLVDFSGKMLETTKEALTLAKKNGHRLFICTGRSKCQIYPWLISMGLFDGIIGGAGAYVECEGKVISHTVMSAENIEKVVELGKKIDFVYGFQTIDGIKSLPTYHDRLRSFFANTGIEEDKIDSILAQHKSVKEGELPKDVEKMFYFLSPAPIDEMRQKLGDSLDVVLSSFDDPDESSGEISTAGVNKATGMEKVIEYYNASVEDTIAFGDGPNDVEMLGYAGIGVAMGNAMDFVKREAYMVTDNIDDHGIMHAMQKLGLTN